MMWLLVYTDEHSFGALSLYCEMDCRVRCRRRRRSAGTGGAPVGGDGAEKQIDQFGLALHNRTINGQPKAC
jgi:hypothetical protein